MSDAAAVAESRPAASSAARAFGPAFRLALGAAARRAERHSLLVSLAFGACFVWVTCRLAALKAIWHDEFYTYYLTRLGNVTDIWRALAEAVDTHPPLFFWITRGFQTLLGEGHVQLRLPGILGLWAAALLLYFFVRARSSGLYGIAAFLIPLVTEAFAYSYEARPYGLLLFFCSAALLAWQRSAVSRIAACALALALALAISCHYYATLMFLPVVCGETVRTWRTGRINAGVWLALLAGAAPLPAFWPLIAATRAAYPAPVYLAPHWVEFGAFYSEVFFPFIVPGVAALVALSLCSLRPLPRVTRSFVNHCPPEETVAAVATLLIPVAMLLLAKLVTHATAPRYSLEALLGLAILLPLCVHRYSRGSAGAGLALASLLACAFFLVSLRAVAAGGETARHQIDICEFLSARSEPGQHIVAADANLFLKLRHYGTPDVAGRLLYIADPQRSIEHIGDGSVDLEIRKLARWASLDIRSYEAVVRSGRPFLLFGYVGQWNWILSALTADGIQPVLKDRYGDLLLFQVNP